MKHFKTIFYLFLSTILLILINSCSEECKTITKFTDLRDYTFKIGESVSIFSGYKLKLISIKFYSSAPIDTLVSKDSVVNADYCTFEIMKSDSSDKVSFDMSNGAIFEYGNHDMSGATVTNPVKIICNSFDLSDSTLKIVVWNSTFMVDCGDWQ